MAVERRFRAMGSDAHVIVVGGAPELADRARERIDELEARWSRFRADSEISRLNRQAGTPVSVSADTVGLVERAVSAWRLSGGAFDPTVLGPMLRAGYDRSFEDLGGGDPRVGRDGRARPGQVEAPGPSRPGSRLGIGAANIVVAGDAVTLPAGTGFDPGGIGKGLAADLVVAELLAAGAEGACVNLGGDVRVAGAAPGAAVEVGAGPTGCRPPRWGGSDPTSVTGWTVGVWHPDLAGPVVRIGLADGAVATSTTRLRRWTVDGAERHHLIDPRSGLPSESDIDLATVVAAEAWMADVLAKSVILRGSAHPFDVVDATAAQALAVDRTGRVQATAGLAAYLGPQALPGRVEGSGPAAPDDHVGSLETARGAAG